MTLPKLIWHLDNKTGDHDLIRIILEGVAASRTFIDPGEFIASLAATAHTELPDLALIDVNMLRLDGIALLKLIRNDPRLHGLRVCVLSDTLGTEAEPALEQLGADCVLLKPTTFDGSLALQERVRAVLGGSIAPAAMLLKARSAGARGSP